METLLFGMFLAVATIAIAWFFTKALGFSFPGLFIDFGKYLLLVLIISIFANMKMWWWSGIFTAITLIIFLLSKKK